jgi:hypothetical protein
MPMDKIISPRPMEPRSGLVVPHGTQGPPWLQPKLGPVEYARTYVAERGPQLVRAADEPDERPFMELRHIWHPRP